MYYIDTIYVVVVRLLQQEQSWKMNKDENITLLKTSLNLF